MGIFNKVLSGFEGNTYKSIATAMFRAYQQAKKQNPKASERELSALALDKRPTWEREGGSFTFTKGRSTLTIEKGHTLRDVIRDVIIIETMPAGASHNPEFAVETLRKMSKAINEVIESHTES